MRPISKRKLKSYQAAEVVCRQLRLVFEAGPQATQQDWNKVLDLIIKWLRVTGKIKYVKP